MAEADHVLWHWAAGSCLPREEREREQMDHPALYEDKCDVSDQSGGARSLRPQMNSNNWIKMMNPTFREADGRTPDLLGKHGRGREGRSVVLIFSRTRDENLLDPSLLFSLYLCICELREEGGGEGKAR